MKPVSRRTTIAAIAAVLAVMAGPSSTTAHMATELYIPVGRSPGVSKAISFLGTLQAYDAAQRIVTVRGEAETITVSITDRTRIWLDRSKVKKRNLVGDTSALRVGRRMEVKFESADRKQFADWIKVEITRSD